MEDTPATMAPLIQVVAAHKLLNREVRNLVNAILLLKTGFY
jgi:hypothetical protein